MGDLNIDIICANSAPAKGRVERAHQTMQDRLVKELRLLDISTMDGANAYAPAFMADYNTTFASGANPRASPSSTRDRPCQRGRLRRTRALSKAPSRTTRFSQRCWLMCGAGSSSVRLSNQCE